MRAYRALTWDHPRGYNALAAAAAQIDPSRDGIAIHWDKQSLEGFESHPIADLCARYDLVVLDHPHVGEAVANQCLLALEDVFGEATLAELEAATIGPCLSSYRFGDRHWALPLDAAAQVVAARVDRLGRDLPTTWDEVIALSRATGEVALSLAGPHAFVSLLSMWRAFVEIDANRDEDSILAGEAGRHAYEVLRELSARSPLSIAGNNPIGILGHMARHEDVALCPLIFGYVTYAAPNSGTALRFANAPRARPGGRPGSVLGGTGIGISRRCEVTPELRRHLLWLLDEESQTTFIPAHDGQPSRRSAWQDGRVNARWGNFYRDTAETLEAAYVRPRYAGFVSFASRASDYVRDALSNRTSATEALGALNKMYLASRTGFGV